MGKGGLLVEFSTPGAPRCHEIVKTLERRDVALFGCHCLEGSSIADDEDPIMSKLHMPTEAGQSGWRDFISKKACAEQKGLTAANIVASLLFWHRRQRAAIVNNSLEELLTTSELLEILRTWERLDPGSSES